MKKNEHRPETITKLYADYKDLNSEIKDLDKTDKKAIADFRSEFRKLRNELINDSILGTIRKDDFEKAGTLLKEFYMAHMKIKNHDGTITFKRSGTMFKQYQTALRLVNSLKIPFIIAKYIELDPNASSLETLSPTLLKTLQNSINPNNDPFRPGSKITSIEMLTRIKTRSDIVIDKKSYEAKENIGSGGSNALIYNYTEKSTPENETTKKDSLAVKMYRGPSMGGEKIVYSDEAKFEIYANSALKGAKHVVAMRGAFHATKTDTAMFAMDKYEMDLGHYLKEKEKKDIPEGKTSRYIPDGRTFQKAASLTETEFTIIMRDVMAGMKEMLEQGIVNRDLKPENIMLEFETDPFTGEKKISGAKLVDFGLIYICPNMDFPDGEGNDPESVDVGTAGYFRQNEKMTNIEKHLSFLVASLGLKLLTGRLGPNVMSHGQAAGLFNQAIASGFVGKATEEPSPAKIGLKIGLLVKETTNDLKQQKGKFEFAKTQITEWILPALSKDQKDRPTLSKLPDWKTNAQEA